MGVQRVRGRCEQNKQDCFAYNKGKCNILSRCDFARDCPFYKTQATYEKGLKDYPVTVFIGKDVENW